MAYVLIDAAVFAIDWAEASYQWRYTFPLVGWCVGVG